MHCYDNKYYIQKTTGTNALNMILNDITRSFGSSNETLDEFHEVIRKSPIKSKDWGTGGIFSGLTSKSGFKKAKEILINGLN